MIELFECKVRYNKVNEFGKEVSVTEHYLVDAVSFCEAETRITKEMEEMISGDFFIKDIKRSKYAEVIQNDDCDRYFKVKVALIDVDDKTGREKRIIQNPLVQADSTQDALDAIDEAYKSVLVTYEKTSVAETPILEVFMYNDNKQQEVL